MPKFLIDLLPGDCRYVLEPVTHDRGAIFCAEPRHGISSMCKKHHALCYQRGTAKRGRSPIALPVETVDVPELVHKIPDVVEGMR